MTNSTENKKHGRTDMKKIFRAAVEILAAVSVLGCSKEAVKSPEIPAEVVVAKPLVMDVDTYGVYSAKMKASEDVDIRARVGGYLEKVLFKKGARVEKGDLLFKIDDKPYAAALAAAEANVKAVESKILLAASNADRARRLFKRKAISKEAYQTRETELLVAKAKLLEAKAAERNARLNLRYTDIVSPVDGKVGENFVDEGNLVSPNLTRLARVVNDSTIKAYFELNSADAARYKNLGILREIDNGNGAEVEMVDGSGSGKLCYYDNSLGDGTASLVVRADMDNSNGRLTVGAYGKIRVMEGKLKGAILIPEEAIGTDLTGRYVLTLNPDDTVRQTPVVLGFESNGMVVVEKGLDKDSRVVVSGLQRATIGRKVLPKTVELKLPKEK